MKKYFCLKFDAMLKINFKRSIKHLPNISFPMIAVALNVAIKWKSWKMLVFSVAYSSLICMWKNEKMLVSVLNILLLYIWKHLCPWFYVLTEVVRVKTGKILKRHKFSCCWRFYNTLCVQSFPLVSHVADSPTAT